MSMQKFKASPLPIPTAQYSPEYMMQLLRVFELYFSKLDSQTPLVNDSYLANQSYGLGTVTWTYGDGSPENVVTAEVGSLYSRTDGGVGTTLYVKESGTGASGWTAFGFGAPVTKTSDFTLSASENRVINNKVGSTCTVTLPTASSWVGREVMFQNYQAQQLVSASSNVVPLGGGAAGTLILAAVVGNTATLVSDGTNWVAMQ